MNEPYPFRLSICPYPLSNGQIDTIYYIGSLIEESGCVNDQNESNGKRKESQTKQTKEETKEMAKKTAVENTRGAW